MMLVRELRRKPVPFLVPIGVLMLLAVLLLFPSAVLDGLLRNTSEVIRKAPADLIVYSWDANGMQGLSQLDPEQRTAVEAVEGVARVEAFDAQPMGATFEGRAEPNAITLMTSEASFTGSFPESGQALVDHSLRDQEGLTEGSLLLIGSNEVAVTIAGFVPDMMLWGLPAVVVDRATWDAATDLSSLASSADAPSEEQAPEGVEPPEGGQLPPGFQTLPEEPEDGAGGPDADGDGAGSGPGGLGTPEAPQGQSQGQQEAVASQALFVTLGSGAQPEAVAQAIDGATDGTTETFTKPGAEKAIPGVEEQQLIFMFIQVVTLSVALFVVGLFVMFLTLERTPFYAVLKAVGASSSQIFSGVIFQALLIAGIAVGLGTVITWGLTHIPLGLPTEMQLNRLLETLVILTAATILGSVLSLFRVARIDPSKAIS